MESVQNYAKLNIAGVIKQISRNKLYNELGAKTLKLRRKYLRVFYKIPTTGVPNCSFG